MHYCIMSNLRTAREAAGLTREELARRAETSTSTIARMELQGHTPGGRVIANISAALDISPAQLLPVVPASAERAA